MNTTSVARKSLLSDGKRAREHQRALFRFVKNLVAKSLQNGINWDTHSLSFFRASRLLRELDYFKRETTLNGYCALHAIQHCNESMTCRIKQLDHDWIFALKCLFALTWIFIFMSQKPLIAT